MFNSAVLRTPCLRFVRRVHKWMYVYKLTKGWMLRDMITARLRP